MGAMEAVHCGLGLERERGSDGRENRESEKRPERKAGPALEGCGLLEYGVWALSKDSGNPLKSFNQGSEGSGMCFSKVPMAAVWTVAWKGQGTQ